MLAAAQKRIADAERLSLRGRHTSRTRPQLPCQRKHDFTAYTSMKTVVDVDFGFTSAKQFWEEVVIPAFEAFKTAPNHANAIVASILAWQIHEWIWYEQHPGENTKNNRKEYDTFKKD